MRCILLVREILRFEIQIQSIIQERRFKLFVQKVWEPIPETVYSYHRLVGFQSHFRGQYLRPCISISSGQNGLIPGRSDVIGR